MDSGQSKAHQAMATLGVWAISADRVINAAEVTALTEAAGQLEIFKELGEEETHDAFEAAYEVLRTADRDELLGQLVEDIPTDLRPTALEFVTDLVGADGKVEDAERRHLHRIRQALGLADP